MEIYYGDITFLALYYKSMQCINNGYSRPRNNHCGPHRETQAFQISSEMLLCVGHPLLCNWGCDFNPRHRRHHSTTQRFDLMVKNGDISNWGMCRRNHRFHWDHWYFFNMEMELQIIERLLYLSRSDIHHCFRDSRRQLLRCIHLVWDRIGL